MEDVSTIVEDAAENDNPHAFEEDPEEHLGEEISDPWNDPDQLDWASNNDDEDEE